MKHLIILSLFAAIVLASGSCRKDSIAGNVGTIYTDSARLNWEANDTVAVTTCHHGVLYFPRPYPAAIHGIMQITFSLTPLSIQTTAVLDSLTCH